VIFGYPVQDPERYGIVTFDRQGMVTSLVEKPSQPASNLAVPGLYVYDGDVVDLTRALRPSARGELEITDLNLAYLREGRLRGVRLGRGIAWLDSGTHDSLLESALFIQTIEKRQGLKIACLEEIALRRGYLDAAGLQATISAMPASPYRDYVEAILIEG
jgi:glucose-1-phosphate thymidylyltransferase